MQALCGPVAGASHLASCAASPGGPAVAAQPPVRSAPGPQQPHSAPVLSESPLRLHRTSSIGSWLRGVELDLPLVAGTVAGGSGGDHAGGGRGGCAESCGGNGGTGDGRAATPPRSAAPAAAGVQASPLLSMASGEILGLLDDLHAVLDAAPLAPPLGQAVVAAAGPHSGGAEQTPLAGLGQAAPPCQGMPMDAAHSTAPPLAGGSAAAPPCGGGSGGPAVGEWQRLLYDECLGHEGHVPMPCPEAAPASHNATLAEDAASLDARGSGASHSSHATHAGWCAGAPAPIASAAPEAPAAGHPGMWGDVDWQVQGAAAACATQQQRAAHSHGATEHSAAPAADAWLMGCGVGGGAPAGPLLATAAVSPLDALACLTFPHAARSASGSAHVHGGMAPTGTPRQPGSAAADPVLVAGARSMAEQLVGLARSSPDLLLSIMGGILDTQGTAAAQAPAGPPVSGSPSSPSHYGAGAVLPAHADARAAGGGSFASSSGAGLLSHVALHQLPPAGMAHAPAPGAKRRRLAGAAGAEQGAPLGGTSCGALDLAAGGASATAGSHSGDGSGGVPVQVMSALLQLVATAMQAQQAQQLRDTTGAPAGAAPLGVQGCQPEQGASAGCVDGQHVAQLGFGFPESPGHPAPSSQYVRAWHQHPQHPQQQQQQQRQQQQQLQQQHLQQQQQQLQLQQQRVQQQQQQQQQQLQLQQHVAAAQMPGLAGVHGPGFDAFADHYAADVGQQELADAGACFDLLPAL